jgi:hypothetical protein
MTTGTLLQHVGALQRAIQGVVLRPGDSEYDHARMVWNAPIKYQRRRRRISIGMRDSS